MLLTHWADNNYNKCSYFKDLLRLWSDSRY